MIGRTAMSVAAASAVVAASWAAEEEAAEKSGGGADVSMGADVVSAYVFRGVTLRSGPAVQPSLEVTLKALPVSVAVWGNLDLEEECGCANAGEFSEIDLSAAYTFDLDPVSLVAGYVEYTYPGVGGGPYLVTDAAGVPRAESTFGQADREVSLRAESDLAVVPYVALNYGVGGVVAGALYAELGGSHEVGVGAGVAIEACASVGYLAAADGPSGFSCYTAGLCATWKALSAGVTYVGRLDADVLPAEDYRVPLYGKVGVSQDF
jgi:hypothetical protein